MTGVLKVRSAGAFATVQDLGRPGFQDLGVPVSGALDATALAIANALAGNPQDAAAIEFRFHGLTLEVGCDQLLVASAGTDAPIDVEGPEPRRISGWSSGIVRRGDLVRAPVPKDTSTAYIAVSGGIDTAPVLGSRATYVRGAIGGFEGRALQPGDLLPVGSHGPDFAPLTVADPPKGVPDRLRVVLGPQDELFADAAVDALLAGSFEVSGQSDRMGLRLEGPELAHLDDYNIVSDAIATGAIQVPGNRQPILLLADHQTTGGYPKIATVISADLPAAGRLRPGDAVGFTAVTVEEAQALAREATARVAACIAGAEPARAEGEVDLDALYRANLISGVT